MTAAWPFIPKRLCLFYHFEKHIKKKKQLQIAFTLTRSDVDQVFKQIKIGPTEFVVCPEVTLSPLALGNLFEVL